MDLTPVLPQGLQVVNAYGPGMFRVAGAAYGGSIIVFPDRTLDWPVTAFGDLRVEDFAEVVAADPQVEVLLLGCGERMILPPAGLRAALRQAGISLEPMDTGAACRTYNVLLAENRRVAAALLVL